MRLLSSILAVLEVYFESLSLYLSFCYSYICCAECCWADCTITKVLHYWYCYAQRFPVLYILTNFYFWQSAEAYDFIKRDLAEFTNVVQHDTACTIAATASAVKDKLAVSRSGFYCISNAIEFHLKNEVNKAMQFCHLIRIISQQSSEMVTEISKTTITIKQQSMMPEIGGGLLLSTHSLCDHRSKDHQTQLRRWRKDCPTSWEL